MFEDMMPFLTALIIGFLLGLERERSKMKEEGKAILGVRTMPLIALLGVLVAHLDNQALLIIIGVFVFTLILANHIPWKKNVDLGLSSMGATSAVAAMLTFLLGYFANFNPHIALILAVIVFGFLAIKKHLHGFVQSGITEKEMNAVLTFLVSAFVILPLLPNEFIDPWQLVHPTRIWLLFVIIAGVEFASYIALRQLGSKLGVLITGLFGGFVSATATTLTLARRVKDQPKCLWLVTSGIILAEVSSLVVQLIVLTIIAPDVLMPLSLFLGVPAFIGVICAALIAIYSSQKSEKTQIEMNIENPISIKSTATFALIISAGLILIALAERWFGEIGVYITSAIGGAASLRVVTFSVSELAGSSEMLVSVAALAIIIAMTTNMMMKLFFIHRAGGVKLFLICSTFFTIMLASSAVVYVMYHVIV